MRVTPHVAQNQSNRRSAIDARTTRHPGYAISQRKRKRVEEIFGWMKTVGAAAQAASPGPRASRVDVHLRGGGLQPGADAHPAGRRTVKPAQPRRGRGRGPRGGTDGRRRGPLPRPPQRPTQAFFRSLWAAQDDPHPGPGGARDARRAPAPRAQRPPGALSGAGSSSVTRSRMTSSGPSTPITGSRKRWPVVEPTRAESDGVLFQRRLPTGKRVRRVARAPRQPLQVLHVVRPGPRHDHVRGLREVLREVRRVEADQHTAAEVEHEGRLLVVRGDHERRAGRGSAPPGTGSRSRADRGRAGGSRRRDRPARARARRGLRRTPPRRPRARERATRRTSGAPPRAAASALARSRISSQRRATARARRSSARRGRGCRSSRSA